MGRKRKKMTKDREKKENKREKPKEPSIVYVCVG
jgi:hypothetical protein